MANGRLHAVLHHLRQLADAAEAGGVSDAQLLERFVAHRDPAAFELLLWRHERLVHNVCRRVLRDAHDADDAFQATFLVLVRKAGSIGRGESVAGWLYRVAYRVALRARAAAVQRERRERRGVDLAEEASPRAESADADWRDLRPVLDAELSRLPERYRIPLVLCYLEGKSYAEAARQLGCSRGTVSTWLTRARELLRRRLTRRGLALSGGLLAGLLAAHAASVSAAGSLIENTVKIALPAAAGKAAVSANVAALTEGVLRAMFLNKVKVVAAVVLAAGILVGGAGALTYPVLASNLVAAIPAAPEEAAAAEPANAAEPPLPLPASGAQPKEHAAWEELARLDGFTRSFTSVAFSPDGTKLATGSLDGNALLWDVASRKKIFQYRSAEGSAIHAVAFSPDGKWLAVASGQRDKAGTVDLLDTAGGKRYAKLQGHDDLVTALAFSPDGKTLATASYDGTARLWDATGAERVAVRVGTGRVFAAAFSPDGKVLATAGEEKVLKEEGKGDSLRLLDAATGRELRRVRGHDGLVTSVAFSPDGKVLASGGADKTTRFWDVETGKELAALKGHQDAVRAVAFSLGGRLLATGSLDRTVKLWDVKALKEVATLKGHSLGVLCVAFAPDGKTLASGSGGEAELGNGEPDVRIWTAQAVPAGGTANAPLPAAAETGGGDRLDQLVQDLLKSKRTDEQAVEAIYLATLGRFPADAEKDGALKHLARKKDRPEALADLLWALTQAKEFGENVDALTKRRLQRPVK